MTRQFMKSRPFTRASTKRGLTLVEVLVAAAIGAIMVSVAMGIAISNRKLLSTDQARTTANQNLRSVLDIMGNDIRITGERLSRRSNTGITALEFHNGNEIVLRRNLSGFSLPLCENRVNKGESNIVVALTKDAGGVTLADAPQCRASDSDNNGEPDNWQAWKEFREGEKIRAYLYTRSGKKDFFTYVGEGVQGNGKRYFIKTKGGEKLKNRYTIDEEPNILLLEEKRYFVEDEVLKVEIDSDPENVLSIINGVKDFEVRAVLEDGTKLADLDEAIYKSAELDWTDVAAVEVSITTIEKGRGKNLERTLTGRYFPRNVLSN